MQIYLTFDRRKTAKGGGKGAVEVCVSECGKRKYFSTGVLLTSKQWKDGSVVKHPNAVNLNLQIQDLFTKVCKLAKKVGFGGLDAKTLAGHVEESVMPLCEWLTRKICERRDIVESTRLHHLTVVNYLQGCSYLKRLTDLTEQNVRRLDNDLRSSGLMVASIYNYHKTIKHYCTVAVREGLLERSPYDGMKIDRGRRDTIRFITDEERERIEALDLGGTIGIVRDMFLLACYTGLSFSDMAKMRPEDFKTTGGRVRLRSHRVKTGGLYSLTILPQAEAVLERLHWRGDWVSNQKANQYLKAIQAMAGIDTKLTMHVGRHTFATWALSHGVSIEVVSKMLGHHDIATTQIYAQVLQSSVDKGFDTLAGL